ncbi:MAG: hypothetical protein QI223_08575 [Candidatus Korarchaeota archaeon]|nr:hypothetical protein [Candidatus Korarchaeota archaeon]
MRAAAQELVRLAREIDLMRMEVGEEFESGFWEFEILDRRVSEGEACLIFALRPSYAGEGKFWVLTDGSVSRAVVEGEEVSSPKRAASLLENYLGPFVAYHDVTTKEYYRKREGLDRSVGRVKRLGKKKFKFGDFKLKAEGYRYFPASSISAPHPIKQIEFWVSKVGEEEILLRYRAEMWVKPRLFWIEVRDLTLRRATPARSTDRRPV